MTRLGSSHLATTLSKNCVAALAFRGLQTGRGGGKAAVPRHCSSCRDPNLTFDRVKKTDIGAFLKSLTLSEGMGLMIGIEVRQLDIVLKRGNGLIAGTEVKASVTLRTSDFRELKVSAKAAVDRFTFGTVLYEGQDGVPFEGNQAAKPISGIWSGS